MRKCDDLLNLLSIKDEEVLTGTYYDRLPIQSNIPVPVSDSDYGIKFQYDIVDEHDRFYSTLLGNLQTENGSCTIKTNDMCGFTVNGYIATQDGSFWQITGIVKRLVKLSTKQALRYLKETAETEYVIRLNEIDNPWELK